MQKVTKSVAWKQILMTVAGETMGHVVHDIFFIRRVQERFITHRLL